MKVQWQVTANITTPFAMEYPAVFFQESLSLHSPINPNTKTNVAYNNALSDNQSHNLASARDSDSKIDDMIEALHHAAMMNFIAGFALLIFLLTKIIRAVWRTIRIRKWQL